MGRGGFEVNGLPKGTVPVNCEILAQGLANTALLGRQEHFLVSSGEQLVYLRVCTASEDSGYDEFAYVHGIATTEDEKARLSERALGFINGNCKAR
jgi:hypothetical protein